MKKYQVTIAAVAAFAVGMVSCKSPRAVEAEQAPAVTPQLIGGTQANYLPKAHIYKTNGDYNDNVPVSLNADGTMITSFPAPTDLTERSTPVVLADGWLLDRRGIGANTVFTRYTYGEYMKLPQVPADLMDAIIPGSRVTEIVELPLGMTEAFNDPALCDKYINDGLKGCTILKK